MKQESNLKKSFSKFLRLFLCMFIVKGIIMPKVAAHKRERQAEKARVEAYQELVTKYALYMMAPEVNESDSVYVCSTSTPSFEE